jgi:DNA-binding transcriptional regulator YiaG
VGHASEGGGGSRRNKFSTLRGKMSPERRARATERAQEMLRALPLQELRHARDLTQATLAESMDCGQDEVSKLERRADMLVSTLRRYVEAMGGSLEIVATFPDGEVRISSLGDLAESAR